MITLLPFGQLQYNQISLIDVKQEEVVTSLRLFSQSDIVDNANMEYIRIDLI